MRSMGEGGKMRGMYRNIVLGPVPVKGRRGGLGRGGAHLDDLARRAGVTGFAASGFVLAREHGDRQDFERVTGFVDAGAQMVDPRSGVDGEEPATHGPDRSDRAAHGVRDVVELEVEKDLELGVAFADRSDDSRTTGDEQLEADLEHADVAFESCGHGERNVGAGDVEGDDQAVACVHARRVARRRRAKQAACLRDERTRAKTMV